MTIKFHLKSDGACCHILPSYFPASGIQHRQQFLILQQYLPFFVVNGAVMYDKEAETPLRNLSTSPDRVEFNAKQFKELADKAFYEYKEWCDKQGYSFHSHLYLPCKMNNYWQDNDGCVGTREVLPKWVNDYLFKDKHVVLTHTYVKDIPDTKRTQLQKTLMETIGLGDSDIIATDALNNILMRYLGWCAANHVKADCDFILPSPKNTKMWSIEVA